MGQSAAKQEKRSNLLNLTGDWNSQSLQMERFTKKCAPLFPQAMFPQQKRNDSENRARMPEVISRTNRLLRLL